MTKTRWMLLGGSFLFGCAAEPLVCDDNPGKPSHGLETEAESDADSDCEEPDLAPLYTGNNSGNQGRNHSD